MLDIIPKLVTLEENEEMIKLPDQEEVKQAFFALNGESIAGPDGFIGLFFQMCWEVVVEDITRLVRAFFCGQILPMHVSHTNLVLLSKKETVRTFSYLRPINVSCLINKVISRVLMIGWLWCFPKLSPKPVRLCEREKYYLKCSLGTRNYW